MLRFALLFLLLFGCNNETKVECNSPECVVVKVNQEPTDSKKEATEQKTEEEPITVPAPAPFNPSPATVIIPPAATEVEQEVSIPTPDPSESAEAKLARANAYLAQSEREMLAYVERLKAIQNGDSFLDSWRVSPTGNNLNYFPRIEGGDEISRPRGQELQDTFKTSDLFDAGDYEYETYAYSTETVGFRTICTNVAVETYSSGDFVVNRAVAPDQNNNPVPILWLEWVVFTHVEPGNTRVVIDHLMARWKTLDGQIHFYRMDSHCGPQGGLLDEIHPLHGFAPL